ncbi:hypothetical protein Q9Q99_17080 [Curtobacterium flaccumfaciens]|nr:hypothetical protein Q9Q99_17080 [Curtobacterium flaccumfaciens]
MRKSLKTSITLATTGALVLGGAAFRHLLRPGRHPRHPHGVLVVVEDPRTGRFGCPRSSVAPPP